jgi:hypothetical protein
MTVGLNAPFNLRQLWINEEFRPAPQIPLPLLGMRWQFDGQCCHVITLCPF